MYSLTQILVDSLAVCDYSCLDYKQEIADFIQMLLLKKPVDETAAQFLELEIHFICFVACACFGASKKLMRFPEVNSNFEIIEKPCDFFGKNVNPEFQEGSLLVGVTEFFTNFVITNLLLIHEVYRKKMSSKLFADYLARSITVLLAYQQLLYIETDLIQIFVHSFYMPTLDDCVSLAGQLNSADTFIISAASEYFVVEMIRFLQASNSSEYIKEILHFLIQCMAEKASNANKNSILFSVSSISCVYAEVALNLNYKDRDTLIDVSCQLMTEAQEKLAELMNRYFEGIEHDREAEVYSLLACYQRVANLISKILVKSFLYLTESVGCS